MEILVLIASGFWIFASAYAANAFPPLLKGEKPLDFGKKIHGKRILGNGKTIKGTVGGILFGIMIGIIEIYFYKDVIKYIQLPELSLAAVVLLSTGAITGDIIGSFIKRQRGLKRGSSAPVLDQLDFVVGAYIFSVLVFPISLDILAFMLIITPFIHILSNHIGYKIGVKQNPW